MEAEPSSITPSGRLVRLFVGGLPLGLIIMGALSFVFYFEKKNRPEPVSSNLATMLRRDINAEDFAKYTNILIQDIGPRNNQHHDNLEAACAFASSTMGFDNMGYQVRRLEYQVEGRVMANIIASLRGKSRTRETVLVLAPYDSTEANAPAEAAATAALFSVAHALTGSTPAREVQFVAVVNSAEKDPKANGCTLLAGELASEGRVVTDIVALAPMFETGNLPPEWSTAKVETLTVDADLNDGPAVVARLDEIKKKVQRTAGME